MIIDLLKLIPSVLGLAQKERHLRREGRLEAELDKRLIECLSDERWSRRTFRVVRRAVRIGTDEELRERLHRIGAVPSGPSGDGELWEIPERLRASESVAGSGRYPWRVFALGTIVVLVLAAAVINFTGAGDTEEGKLIKCLEDTSNC